MHALSLDTVTSGCAVCPTCGRHASECDKTCGFCGAHRRRRRNQIVPGDDSKCPFADYTNRIATVNEACCDEPGVCADGVPTVCDLKCALEFLPFLSECGRLIAANDPGDMVEGKGTFALQKFPLSLAALVV